MASTSSGLGRPTHRVVAHHDPPEGGVADHEPDVDGGGGVDAVEVFGRGVPVAGHARLQGLERHALDDGQHAHQVVALVVAEGGQREPAVPGEHARHPVQGVRGQRLVPEHLGVDVRVHVHEAGRNDETRGVDLPAGVAHLPDGGDTPARRSRRQPAAGLPPSRR